MRSVRSKHIAPTNSNHFPFFRKESNTHLKGEKPFFNAPSIQAELTVNQPNDRYEKEADMMADKMVQRLSDNYSVPDNSVTSSVQPKCATFEKEQELQKKEKKDEKDLLADKLQKKPVFETNGEPDDEKNIWRKCATCEREEKNELQPKAQNDSDVSSDASDASVLQRLGKGNSLNGNTQSKMERAFGTPFSDVEIHNDSNSADLSGKLNARAFTIGKHIAFGKEEYAPGSIEGEALIAHELAHVVQQTGATTGSLQSKGGSAYSSLEADADNAAATAIMSTWGNVGSKDTKRAKKIMPRLKSGLKLQRCGAIQ